MRPCAIKSLLAFLFLKSSMEKKECMKQENNFETAVSVAQMTDLHYCSTNLVESDRCFTAAVTGAIEKNVDCALITGDSTDHAMDAHSPAFVALAKQIQRLANHCPVLMLQGTFSHEPVGLLKVLSMVGAKHPITIAEKISTFGLGENGFELVQPGTTYRLVCTAIPTLNKADIVAMTPHEVGSAAQAAGQIVADVLASLAPMNRALRLQGVPTMVISHGTVMNCLTEHGVPMAGADHEFTAGSLFAACADTVALGHIHKHQAWTSEAFGFVQIIAYGGSIGRFHYGEEDAKVWLEWRMAAGNASFVSYPTPARRTVDVFFDGPPDMHKLREAAQNCDGAFVRVRYEVDAEHKQSVDRNIIKAMFATAVAVQIEGKTFNIERVRAKGISTEPSLAGKLEKWCVATGTKLDCLPAMLTCIQNTEVSQIVSDTIEKINMQLAQTKVDSQIDNSVLKTSDIEQIEPLDFSELPPVPEASDIVTFDMHDDIPSFENELF